MIKLVGVQDINVDIKASFTPSVKTYNIVSGLMSDDCQPYRVAQSVMIWLTPEGFLGEIEAIYPPLVSYSLDESLEGIDKQRGFPLFEVGACDNDGFIQHLENGFRIWFSKEKTTSLLISYKNVDFFVAGDKLLSVAAYHTSLIE